jgi:hypothetical protein
MQRSDIAGTLNSPSQGRSHFKSQPNKPLPEHDRIQTGLDEPSERDIQVYSSSRWCVFLRSTAVAKISTLPTHCATPRLAVLACQIHTAGRANGAGGGVRETQDQLTSRIGCLLSPQTRDPGRDISHAPQRSKSWLGIPSRIPSWFATGVVVH